MNYDIFLSYRRDGGKEWARSLKSELERRGYQVFLDFDELNDGVFDRRIMAAIDTAPIFMILLSPHALDRCVETDDWVRKEIEYALSRNRHFIPVDPDRSFDGFPSGLSDELKKGLGQHQFSEIMFGQLFKESIDKMARNRIDPLLQQLGRAWVHAEKDTSVLKVETDLPCRIYVDYEIRGEAHPNKILRLPLRCGSYRLRFESLECTSDAIEDKSFRIADKVEEWYTVSLQPIRQQREKLEQRNQYLRSLPDDRFERDRIQEDNQPLSFGFRDSQTGELLISHRYDLCWPFHEGMACVKVAAKYGFIDKTGTEVILPAFDTARDFCEGLACVSQSGKYGFIDKTGQTIIPLIYDEAWDFNDGTVCIQSSGHYLFIDKTGKETTAPSNNAFRKFTGDLIRVQKAGKYGFIDTVGHEVLPCIYSEAQPFCEGIASIETEDDTRLLIDRTGREITPLSQYTYIDSFSEGLAAVERSEFYGFIDKNGREVIPCIYDDAMPFHEGMARIQKAGKYGFINKTGCEVIPPTCDYALDFNEGLASIYVMGRYGWVDRKGNTTLLPLSYDAVDEFREGLAGVIKADKHGFVAPNGSEIIPCCYDDADSFCEGLARVLQARQYGYIDKNGREVIPCCYDEAAAFCEGLARVQKAGKHGFIDKNGKIVIPFIYEDTQPFSEGLAGVRHAESYGFIDKAGREIIPCQYEQVQPFCNGLARVRKAGKYGFINTTGEEVIPIIYDDADTYIDNNSTTRILETIMRKK